MSRDREINKVLGFKQENDVICVILADIGKVSSIYANRCQRINLRAHS